MLALTKNQRDTSTSFDIPNSTIFSGAVIAAIVNVVSSIVTNIFFTMPENRAEHVLSTKKFEIEALQSALESDDDQSRANSLKILIYANILDDPTGKIISLTKSPISVPKWSANASKTAATKTKAADTTGRLKTSKTSMTK